MKLFAGLALIGSAVIASCVAKPSGAPGPHQQSAVAKDSLRGTFHIVYGDKERYFLVEDGVMNSIELIFAPPQAGEQPSVLAYDRRRVSVFGNRDRNRDRIFHVTRISLFEGASTAEQTQRAGSP